MIYQNDLYNKLQFAKDKYNEYSINLIEKYSRGNINKSVPLKLAVINKWLQYLDSRITRLNNLKLSDPKTIRLTNIQKNINSGVRRSYPKKLVETFYITDIYDRTIPISRFYIYETDSLYTIGQKIATGIYNSGYCQITNTLNGIASHVNIFPRTNNEQVDIDISFSNVGGIFNNKTVHTGANLITFNSPLIKGGVSEINRGIPLASDSIESYNKILDTIAVDLKFSYSNMGSDYSTNIPLSSMASRLLSSEDNEEITNEGGGNLRYE